MQPWRPTLTHIDRFVIKCPRQASVMHSRVSKGESIRSISYLGAEGA